MHPSAFASCDAYAEEFANALTKVSDDGLVVINYDDDRTRAFANQLNHTTIKTIGVDRFGADLLAFNIKVGIERIGFDLRLGDERYLACWSPILGKHHLYSLLAAIQVALFMDIDVETSLKSLTELTPISGRMTFYHGVDNCIVVDDSFAASFGSTIAALEWLQDVRDDGQRTILILGDMDNLGRNSRYAHRTVGQQASQIADIIITQGVEAALAGRSAIDSGVAIKDVFTTYSTQDVLSVIDTLDISDNDIILVKGGEKSSLETVVAALVDNESNRGLLIRHRTAVEPTAPNLRPSWVDIDADALATNVQVIKDHIGDDVTLMAVVKADAYGHGAVLAARTAVTNGAEYLAVASIAEAIELRDAGITTPILVLTYAPPEVARQAHQLDITLTVFDLEIAELYDRMARTVSGKLKVHIKIDSGMGRLGIFAEDAVHAFRHLRALTNLDIEGIYTHFSSADDDPEVTELELERFTTAIRPLRAAGINVKYTHAANSPGTLLTKANHFNLVRPGLMLYGLSPSQTVPLYDEMRPVMSWKTRILQVKEFPAGHPIGYNGTYTTRSNERIAILPIGYADGFRRAPHTWEYVLVHGQRAPVVGRVSMEKVAIKVDGIADVRSGDEVVLLGRQGSELITAEMIAEWLGTSNYEVVTTILPRVPR
ncbi:MAG: alanine racemase [Chloroflexota bacterium]